MSLLGVKVQCSIIFQNKIINQNVYLIVSPIDSFYQNWKKAFEERKIIRQKLEVPYFNSCPISVTYFYNIFQFDEDSVPKIKKHPKKAASDGPPELFPSDDEDDEDINILKYIVAFI